MLEVGNKVECFIYIGCEGIGILKSFRFHYHGKFFKSFM